MLRLCPETGQGDREQHRREDHRRDDVGRAGAPVRTTERRASRAGLVGSRHHAGSYLRPPTSCSSPSSSAPSSDARVLARKTSVERPAGAATAVRPREDAHRRGRTVRRGLRLAVRSRDRDSAHGCNRLTEAGEDRGRAAVHPSAGSAGTTSTVGRAISAFSASGALGHDPPVVDDADAVGNVGFLEAWRGREDGHPPPWPGAHLLPESSPALNVEPGGRLVEEEDARAVDGSASARSSLRFIHAGVAAHLAVSRMVEADTGQHHNSSERGPRSDRGSRLGSLQTQVLTAGEQRIERGLLQRRPDRLAHLRPCFTTSKPPTRATPDVGGNSVARASAPWSTCLLHSGRGSRRSRQARLRGRCRRARPRAFLELRTRLSASMAKAAHSALVYLDA